MKRALLAFGILALACGDGSDYPYPYFRLILSSYELSPVNIRYHNGYIYFLDQASGELWRVDSSGDEAVHLGPSGYEFDVSSTGIAVGSFQGENRVDVYDLSGNLQHSAVLHGTNPFHVRYDPMGNLYAAVLTEGDAGPLLVVDPDSGTADTAFARVGAEFCVTGTEAFYYDPETERVVACTLGDTATYSFWTGKPDRPGVYLDNVYLDMAGDARHLLVSPLLILDVETGATTSLHTSPYDQGSELEGSVAWGASMDDIYFNATKLEFPDSSMTQDYEHYWSIWYYGNPE